MKYWQKFKEWLYVRELKWRKERHFWFWYNLLDQGSRDSESYGRFEQAKKDYTDAYFNYQMRWNKPK